MNITQINHDLDNNIPIGEKDIRDLIQNITILESALIKFAEINGSYPLEVLQFIKNNKMLERIIK